MTYILTYKTRNTYSKKYIKYYIHTIHFLDETQNIMALHWPHKQGLKLNKEVANLFFATKEKFTKSLSNQTSYSLYIDILDDSFRYKLFSFILTELEILILDIIELDLTLKNIQLLQQKILYDLAQKALFRFLSNFDSNNFIISHSNKTTEFMLLLSECQLNLEYLLIYLIFGSRYAPNNIFTFDKLSTPKEHVSILLENFIIQISNFIIFSLLKNIHSLTDLTSFIHKYSLCNKAYLSVRSLAFFRNSIIIQNFVQFYIQKPKEIYSSRYKVWLISSSGLVSKYIFMNRLSDLSKLSNIQLACILLIEIQDLIIPKLEKFLLMTSKIILYIFINLLGNSIIVGIRIIISGIHRINR